MAAFLLLSGRSKLLPRKDGEMGGLIGVCATKKAGEVDIARTTYYGLFTEQHRGHESAGIAVSNGETISLRSGPGQLIQVFNENWFKKPNRTAAIGHVRYSPTGVNTNDAPPVVVGHSERTVAVAHDGNLTNSDSLKQWLSERGNPCQGSSDSEVVARLIESHAEDGRRPLSVLPEVVKMLRGSYSLVVLTPTSLTGIRDPAGFKPLCFGSVPKQANVIASESCALGALGIKDVIEVSPGTAITFMGERTIVQPLVNGAAPRLCVFEFVHIGRPDSSFSNRSVYLSRQEMGRILARNHPVPDANLVCPVPDAAMPQAIGFSAESGIQLNEALVKSRYAVSHKLEIGLAESMIKRGAAFRYQPIAENIRGKKLVIVDDSLVTGFTAKKLTGLLRAAGAREIHWRIGSPPVKGPCQLGTNMEARGKVLLTKTDALVQEIGATSIEFLTIEELKEAIGNQNLCLNCFLGESFK